MKLAIALVFTWLAVLTAKKTRLDVWQKLLRGPEFDEDNPDSPLLDLAGTLQRSFATEAISLNFRGNVICSPLSALLPLGKLILGTEPGKSRNEMLEAAGTTHAMLKPKFKDLLERLKYLPGVTLSIASRLFVNEKVTISSQYLKETEAVFHSTLGQLNFQDSATSADTINDWVNEQTRGKIKEIIQKSDIRPSDTMMLVNAIYFAGRWAQPFRKVFSGEFHAPTGKRKIEMMTKKELINYAQSKALDATIVELPYAGDGASFVIVLPHSKIGLPMLLSELKLAPELLNTEMMKMEPTTVSLTMPKFKIETELDLKTLYEKIGVKAVFTKHSGLTRITDSTVFLSKAIQKAFIEVTEKGTEAAAATLIQIMTSSLFDLPKKEVVVVADRPFLFFVKATQQQLFFGSFIGS